MLSLDELRKAQDFITENNIEYEWFFYNTDTKEITLNFKEAEGKNFIVLKAHKYKLIGYSVPISKYYKVMNMLKYQDCSELELFKNP